MSIRDDLDRDFSGTPEFAEILENAVQGEIDLRIERELDILRPQIVDYVQGEIDLLRADIEALIATLQFQGDDVDLPFENLISARDEGGPNTVLARVIVVRRNRLTRIPVLVIDGVRYSIPDDLTTIEIPDSGIQEFYWEIDPIPGLPDEGWGNTTVRLEITQPRTKVSAITSYGRWHYPWPGHRNFIPGGRTLWGAYRLRRGGSGGLPPSPEFTRWAWPQVDFNGNPLPPRCPVVFGLFDYGN